MATLRLVIVFISAVVLSRFCIHLFIAHISVIEHMQMCHHLFITVARDSGRLLCFSCFFLFCPQVFDIPEAFFCKNVPHDAVCSKIDCPVGVHMCPLKNLMGKKTIFANLRTHSGHFESPPFHNAREIGKSKMIGSICG